MNTQKENTLTGNTPSDKVFSGVNIRRCNVDLATGLIEQMQLPCDSIASLLGGYARAFRILGQRDVTDAYDVNNPLILNTGILTGTNIMTGLRAYFSAYSPLKHSDAGLPSAMWSAASGKFGSKLKWAGIDEVIFEGRSERPVMLHIKAGENGPEVHLLAADKLVGLTIHEKIMALQKDYPDAHFAAIGPAGENYKACFIGAIGLSTVNQLKSSDDKCRWAGRGGMGSIMGCKNLLAIIAEAPDRKVKPTPEEVKLNKEIAKGPGSRKFREKKKGGLGGTWANYDSLEPFHFVPENNFWPKGTGKPELLFREAVESQLVVKAESCFKCGIACHKNVYEQGDDGKRGQFLAKFDFEPLNLLSTNLGIHDPVQAAELISLCDHYGMDSISLGSTLSYVLDYNERHVDAPIANGARFGDFQKVRSMVEDTGNGRLPAVGHGVKRLSESLQETAYAMHVKGLELPAYLPDTNPGYPWAVAGGHMSMMTYMLYALEGDTSVDYWVRAITERGLYCVRDDLTGLCKFSMLDNEGVLLAIETATGIKLSTEELLNAVRESFIYALWLERKQGYTREEYTLPSQVFDDPNPVLKPGPFISREFFSQLSERVWEVFDQEIAAYE